MLAYAANRHRIAAPRSAPHAMLVIIAAHIALIAAVMSAKMDLPTRIQNVTKVRLLPLPDEPPPVERPQPRTEPKPSPSELDRMPVIVPIPQPNSDLLDPKPVQLPVPGDIAGPAADPLPRGDPAPKAAPVRVGPRFATPASAVRPPYPSSKIASDEEAVLKLRLGINEHGRVTSVEPIGKADPAFLQAARRHLIARWRYKPATEDGRAVASSTVITLRFELEG